MAGQYSFCAACRTGVWRDHRGHPCPECGYVPGSSRRTGDFVRCFDYSKMNENNPGIPTGFSTQLNAFVSSRADIDRRIDQMRASGQDVTWRPR